MKPAVAQAPRRASRAARSTGPGATLAAVLSACALCAPACERALDRQSSPGSVPGVEFLARGELAGDTRDPAGRPGDVPGTKVANDRVGSIGSALAYTGADERYVALCDAGPGGDDARFATRFHTITLELDIAARTLSPRLEKTSWFHGQPEAPFLGTPAAADLDDDQRARCLDPEGARVSPRGTLFTADEHGPWIDEWSASGEHLRRLALPGHLRVPHRSLREADELPPRATTGRVRGRGFEGLAISPDGARLVAALQGPLLQDGALNGKGKRVGVNVRFVELELASGKTREFVYVLDDPDHSVSEVLALGERALLVLERDGEAGAKARCKRVYRVELPGAGASTGPSDVTAVASLSYRGLPDGVTALEKRLFLDLLDPRFGLAGESMPEKLEGLAFGPTLPDGRRLLVIASDNDFSKREPTRFFAFAIEPAALAGFEAQRFDAPWNP